MKQCPKCHTQWDDSKRFCPYDGSPLPNAPAIAAPNADFQATGVMNPAQVSLANPVPTSVQATYQPAGLGTSPVPQPEASVAVTQPSPGTSPPVPSRSPLLRSTDETPTVKASRPLDVWPPQEKPATPSHPLPLPTVPPDSGGLVLDIPLLETPVVATVPPPAVAPAAQGNFTPGTWGGSSPDDLGFHFEGASQPLTAPPGQVDIPTVPAPQTPQIYIPPPPEISPDDIPKTMSVFQVAQLALDKKRQQTGGHAVIPAQPRRSHAEYFQLLNERNRIVQQFVELLSKQGFHYTTSYSNKDDHLLYKFILMFGDEVDTRSFPISVALHRKPYYAVVVSIDLHDIGDNITDRTKRTEQLGGVVERTDRSISFRLDATEDLPNEYLMRWLDENFKAIFQYAYEA
ncbi:MAG: hypothetical protein K1Y36_26390 [Blastocatellia bacterium]|nr:hypothetical protein [Blastocatellia bacterium]